jgi:hypothetical protein
MRNNEVLDLMEMFKLAKGLEEKGIPFDFVSSAYCKGAQIFVYDENGNQEWDAICNEMSYGRYQGLIEIMGTIVDEVATGGDSVEGCLTAEDILKRL